MFSGLTTPEDFGPYPLRPPRAAITASACRTVCLAEQPLAVLELQLSEDTDGDKLMTAAGSRGNANRRAVPTTVVRYATALPSLSSQKVFGLGSPFIAYHQVILTRT